MEYNENTRTDFDEEGNIVFALLARRPITLDTGTPYGCTRQELRKTIRPRRRFHPVRTVSPQQAVNEIKACTSTTRTVTAKLEDAVRRLRGGLDRVKYRRWSPDLLVKMFADLDLVFFNGKLLGNVKVSWVNTEEEIIAQTCPRPRNQCVIELNPHYVGVIVPGQPKPFQKMFGTLLHEMCVSLLRSLSDIFFLVGNGSNGEKKHAYFKVRCSDRDEVELGEFEGGHGLEFYSMLQNVGYSAMINLGMTAIAASSDLLYNYFMDHREINRQLAGMYEEEGPEAVGNLLARGDAMDAVLPGTAGFTEGLIGLNPGDGWTGRSCGGVNVDESDDDFDDDDDDDDSDDDDDDDDDDYDDYDYHGYQGHYAGPSRYH